MPLSGTLPVSRDRTLLSDLSSFIASLLPESSSHLRSGSNAAEVISAVNKLPTSRPEKVKKSRSPPKEVLLSSPSTVLVPNGRTCLLVKESFGSISGTAEAGCALARKLSESEQAVIIARTESPFMRVTWEKYSCVSPVLPTRRRSHVVLTFFW
jgi:hypothetical protein